MGRGSWWWELRADGPPGADASRDSGRVPLSSQKNAKGGGLPPPRRVRARRPVGAVYWRDEGRKRKGVEGEMGLAKARRCAGALWAPRHREIVGVKLKKGLSLST